jgi:hypothetical protein
MGEVSENADPLRKGRRRWLIVGLVLAIVFGVGWWNWPRLDSRLVGRWQPDDNSYSWEFDAKGNYFWVAGPSVFIELEMQWCVRRGVLCITPKAEGWMALQIWWERVRRGSFEGDRLYRIEYGAVDQITLKPIGIDGPPEIRLRRVRE